jgi:hypothetical protein
MVSALAREGKEKWWERRANRDGILLTATDAVA